MSRRDNARLVVEPFRKEHAFEIVFGDHAYQELKPVHHLADAYTTFESGGPGFTGRLDGRILGCAGLLVHWPGVAHAWVLASKDVPHHPVTFHREIAFRFPPFIQELKLWRVQAEVDEAYDIGRRWARRMGFQEEGTMPLYGPTGQTYIRYALLIPENLRTS